MSDEIGCGTNVRLNEELGGNREVGWQPIDTAPKDGNDFLAYSDASKVFGVAYFTFYGGSMEPLLFCKDSVGVWFSPTHWMPLPLPPNY